MKILEFLSVICFLLAGAAGEDSYGMAVILLVLAGMCAFLSLTKPKQRKEKRNGRY